MRRTPAWKAAAAAVCVLAVGVPAIPLLQTDIKSIFAGGDQEMKYEYEQTLTADALDSLAVSWMDGEIELVPLAQPGTPEDGQPPEPAVRIVETAQNPLREDEKAQLTLRGESLQINWNRKSKLASVLDLSSRRKDLRVELPEHLFNQMRRIDCENVSGTIAVYQIAPRELHVKSVSGEIQAQQITSDEISLSSVSGDLLAESLHADRLRLSSTSGAVSARQIETEDVEAKGVSSAVYLQGLIRRVYTHTISGNTEVASSVCPQLGRLESVSGSLYLKLPPRSSFRAEYTSVSGRFDSRFDGQYDHSAFITESGLAQLRLSTTSGPIQVDPLEAT